MADKYKGSPALQSLLQSALPHADRESLRDSVLPALLTAVSDISLALRASATVTAAGTSNDFGDEQLNVDVSAERAMRRALGQCPSVATASSEEDPVETSISPDGAERDTTERYTVAFDPLDGSSIIAPNWSVGTIIGVWDGSSALNQSPRSAQIAAVLGVFGPRTTAIVALRVPGPVTDSTPLCFELGLDPVAGAWDVVRSSVQLTPAPPYKTRYFAPANLRAAAESPEYMRLVSRSISEKYTLRYSGGLVPDLVHALVKGHGVYISPVTTSSPPKLRRLYELCPVALILECAGGSAVDPVDGSGILDKPLAHTDERGGLLCGNKDEVERALQVLNSTEA